MRPASPSCGEESRRDRGSGRVGKGQARLGLTRLDWTGLGQGQSEEQVALERTVVVDDHGDGNPAYLDIEQRWDRRRQTKSMHRPRQHLPTTCVHRMQIPTVS